MSNLSGGWKFKGDLPCRRCLRLWRLVCGVSPAKLAFSDCARTFACTRSPSLSLLLKPLDTGDSQTTFAYPFIHCVKRPCPAQSGINYGTYDPSAVFAFA